MHTPLDAQHHASKLQQGGLALQASLNMCSLTMSNLLLASILRVADTCVSAEEESHFILECRTFALRCAGLCEQTLV